MTYYVVPEEVHNKLVEAAYIHRGYTSDEAADGARFCSTAAYYGIRTHHAIKALHLDELFGSKAGKWMPGAEIKKIDNKFLASEVWDSQKKLGPAVAYKAMDTCIKLADQYGVGIVSVENATHYLWGGGYVIDAALKGYIAYTNCTSATSEVVPYGGKRPTMGTNPHSWAFPTQDAVGFPIVVDWATSTVAMGRVQQFKRESKKLPPNSAVDRNGHPTIEPDEAVALLPFGMHKGYGLGLVDELYSAYTGGCLPSQRGVASTSESKSGSTFFFQVIHPEAINSHDYVRGLNQSENVRAILNDILGQGNEKCLLPGQIEAEAAQLSAKHEGLLFTEAELTEFAHIAEDCQQTPWDMAKFKSVEI